MSLSEPPVAIADGGGPTGRGGPDDAKSPIATLYAPPRVHHLAESSDDYPAIVAILDGKTRVIECANAIQWIIQKRNGGKWRSTHFCRTKAGLLLYARPITPELLALPDFFPERTDDWTDWPPHQDERCTVQSARE
jgi:hypothetical protein